MTHAAPEGRCSALGANRFLTRADPPGGVHPAQGEDPGTVPLDGGSTVVSPPGEVPAGRLRGTGGVPMAELDPDGPGRSGFDLAGHCARPDAFALPVDRAARPRGRPAA